MKARLFRALCSPVTLRLFAALFFAACQDTTAQRPECRTACLLKSEGLDCVEVGKAEVRAIYALGMNVRGWSPESVCRALSGWTLRVHHRSRSDVQCATPAWKWRGSICVKGFTDSDYREVWVADDDLKHNAFTHELVHVVDYTTEGHAGHCGWPARGVIEGLYQATGTMDPSTPEADCPK